MISYKVKAYFHQPTDSLVSLDKVEYKFTTKVTSAIFYESNIENWVKRFDLKQFKKVKIILSEYNPDLTQ